MTQTTKPKFWWTLRNGNYIIPGYASDTRRGVAERFNRENTMQLDELPHLEITKIRIEKVK